MIKIKDKENVKKQIFLGLIKSKGPITVSMLAKEISMSGKSIRNYLKILQNELAEKGVNLIIKPNVGVYLDVSEEDKKTLSMDIPISNNEDEKYSPQYRRNYILKTLLKNKYTYTLQLFAEDLYCSKGTIFNDLVFVQCWLEKRGLQLKRKQHQGLWIEGNEKKYRRAMMDLFLKISENNDTNVENELDKLDYRIDFINYKKIKQLFRFIDLFKIQSIIQQAEQELEYYFTDQAFMNLITHIAIAIERIKNKKEIKMTKEHFESLKDKHEFHVATWVVQRLSEEFHVTFSEDEIGYISLHMLGAKIQEDSNTDNYDLLLDVENLDYINIAKEIMSMAGDILNINFSHDQQLLTALILHLRPTVARLKYGLKLRNPILQTIKDEYTSIFGAAWACSSIFEKRLSCSINEDEVGYIAMHLAAGVGRLNQKVKTVVVCSSGVGTSQLISTRLQERFHQLDIISIIPLRSLNDEIIQKSDLIISTIPGISDSSNLVYVSTILDATDVLKIKSVLKKLKVENGKKEDTLNDLESGSIKDLIDEDLCFIDSTKNDFVKIINHYGSIMKKRDYVKKGFCKNVLEREKIGSTVIGKGFAIPHSRQEFVNKSKICIIKLKDPITWDGQKLKLIILLAFNPKDLTTIKVFYKKLYSILNNENSISQIMSSDNKRQIINIFLNGGN